MRRQNTKRVRWKVFGGRNGYSWPMHKGKYWKNYYNRMLRRWDRQCEYIARLTEDDESIPNQSTSIIVTNSEIKHRFS